MPDEDARRRRRTFIWVATSLALGVVATCFAASETALAGAVAATRYSARFSGLVMAAAVLARAPRPVGWARWRTELTFAFVAAHGVHYAAVALRAWLEPGSKLRTLAIDVVVVVLLLWIYYSAMILYLGAEFTHVYAAHRGGTRGGS